MVYPLQLILFDDMVDFPIFICELSFKFSFSVIMIKSSRRGSRWVDYVESVESIPGSRPNILIKPLNPGVDRRSTVERAVQLLSKPIGKIGQGSAGSDRFSITTRGAPNVFNTASKVIKKFEQDLNMVFNIAPCWQ